MSNGNAFDWDAIDAAIDDAADSTDAALAGRVSSLTRLTDAEVAELFPEPADVKRLAELMKIVKSAEDRNAKVNRLVDNIEDLAGTVLTLIGKLA